MRTVSAAPAPGDGPPLPRPHRVAQARARRLPAACAPATALILLGATAALAGAAPAPRVGPAAAGEGVTVGVIDTGIDPSHPELAGAVASTSIDIYGGPLLNPDSSHGTSVASIIAARPDGVGVDGVAPGSSVLAVRADTPGSCAPSCSFDDDRLAAATNYAVANGGRVINYSLGGPTPSAAVLENAFVDAAQAGTVLVFAAGNAATEHPYFPGRYASDGALNGQAIVVGAVDGDGRLADFSARAGAAAPFYLVAPGVDILGAENGGGYDVGSGTSLAAPLVAGTAAAVLSVWPHLAAAEVVDVLLVTATDLGAPGVDPVYGRGLLNPGRVFSPVGTPRLPTGATVDDGGVALSASAVIRAGAALGPALASSGVLRRAVVIDDYGRDFGVDLTARIAADAGLVSVGDWLEAPQALPFGGDHGGGGARLTFAFDREPVGGRFDDGGAGGAGAEGRRIDRFALTGDLGRGVRYAFSQGFGIGGYFGLTTSHGEVLAAQLRRDSFASPYLGLVEDGDGAVIGADLGAGFELRAGFSTQDAAGAESAHGGAVTPRNRGTAFVTELRRSWSNGTSLGLQVGALTERGGLLGTGGEGVFELSGEAATRFVGVSAALPVGERVEVYGHAGIGRTDGGAIAAGLFDGVSTAASSAFGAGVGITDVVTDADRLDVTLSQPIRLGGGEAEVTAATGVADDGTVIRETERVDLEPSARQLDLELAYTAELGGGQSLQLNAVTQFNPGHDADAGPEAFVGLRYRLRF